MALRHIIEKVYLNRTIVVAADSFIEARPVTRLLMHLDSELIASCNGLDVRYTRRPQNRKLTVGRADTATRFRAHVASYILEHQVSAVRKIWE